MTYSILKKGIYFLTFSLILSQTSCNKNKCDEVACNRNEICQRGNCFCLDGFEAPGPDMEIGEQIVHFEFGNGEIQEKEGNVYSVFFTNSAQSRDVPFNDCVIPAYLKYEGNYQFVSEVCQGGPGFNVAFGTIQASVSPINELILINFLNSGQNATAYISTDSDNKGNSFVIPNQSLGGSGFTVSGRGTYLDFGASKRVQIEIQANQNGTSKACTLTYQ